MARIKKALLISGVVILLIIFFFHSQKYGIKSKSGDRQVPADAAAVKKEIFTDIIESEGRVKAKESVNITSTVSDRVSGIFFEDGGLVEKDQILVTLNSDEEESLLMQAQATLIKQELQSNRIQQLLKRNAASRAQAEEEEGLLKIARAKVENIEAQLRDYKIRAPFAGVLGMRMISLGAVIDSNTVITRLDDISSVKLDFQVTEILLSAIQPGMTVNAESKAYPGKIFQGKVTVISSCVDPDSRSVTVRAAIPNPEYILKPGMQMKVKLIKKT